jgi:hypothetical protein
MSEDDEVVALLNAWQWQGEGFDAATAARLPIQRSSLARGRFTATLVLAMAQLCADVDFDPPNRGRNIAWLRAAVADRTVAGYMQQHATHAQRRHFDLAMKRLNYMSLLMK